MNHNDEASSLPKRKSPRLKQHDYASNGAYFVTICTNERQMLFGHICDSQMLLSSYGRIAEEEIEKTNRLRKEYGIKIAKYAVMPNHVHMLIEIVGTRRAVSVPEQREHFSVPTYQSVPTVVRAYKSAVSKRVHAESGHGTPCPYIKVWQSRFHEHIIRDKRSYWTIWKYIHTNPEHWENDCFYTDN